MSASPRLGTALERVIDKLVTSGLYVSREDAISDGPKSVEEYEKLLAEFKQSLTRGLADAEAGRSQPMEEVFDELRARFGKPSGARGAN
jgi:antitoxin ParD1/3/4